MAKSDSNLTALQQQLEELQEKIRLQEQEKEEEEKEPPLPVDQQMIMTVADAQALLEGQRELQRKVAELEMQRATGPARGKLLTLPVVDVNERIRLALTAESKDNRTLALELKMSEDKVKTLMQDLRAQGKVFNVKFEEDPHWVWRVGDDAPGPVLRASIIQLITERPMELHDLVRITGARRQKVSGHMIEIQRTHEVLDMSGGGHAKMYLLVTDKIASAKLAKKLKPETEPDKKKPKK